MKVKHDYFGWGVWGEFGRVHGGRKTQVNMRRKKKQADGIIPRTMKLNVMGLPREAYDRIMKQLDNNTKLARIVTHELMIRDVPPWKNDGQFIKLGVALGGIPDSVGYRIVMSDWAKKYRETMPSFIVGNEARTWVNKFDNARLGVYLHDNDSFSNYTGYDAPLIVTRCKGETRFKFRVNANGNYVIGLPIYRNIETAKTEWQDFEIMPGRRDGYTGVKPQEPEKPSKLEQVRRGDLKCLSISVIAERGKVKRVPVMEEKMVDGRKVMVHVLKEKEVKGQKVMVKSWKDEDVKVFWDKNGKRFTYHINLRLCYGCPVADVQRHGTMLLHTDCAHFLVARSSKDVIWKLVQEHMHNDLKDIDPVKLRKLIGKHDQLVYDLRCDSKMGDKGSRATSTERCSGQDRRVVAWVYRMVKYIVTRVDKRNFAEVRWCAQDRGFFAHFDYSEFRRILCNKLSERHITLEDVVLKFENGKPKYSEAFTVLTESQKEKARLKAALEKKLATEQKDMESLQTLATVGA